MRTSHRLELLFCILFAGTLLGQMKSQAAGIHPAECERLSNAVYRLAVTATKGEVLMRFQDSLSGMTIADGPYLYSAKKFVGENEQSYRGLENASVLKLPDNLIIRGTLAGLELEHHFTLASNRLFLEEVISLHNASPNVIALSDFEAGFQRPVVDRNGKVLSEFARDRWVAIPLRARATDPKGFENDFSVRQLVDTPGYEPYVNKDLQYTQVPSRHRRAEGWAWTHGDTTLGIFVFNQENMLFSVVSSERTTNGAALRFGGACMISGEPAALSRIAPGQTVNLGAVRYQSMKGGDLEAAYAFRALLDEKGCRFPTNYNPPVHWEQLYDMNGAWADRSRRYTKAILEHEAEKARAFSCEALYLDPGWDTDFGSLDWGEKWLGPRRDFIEEMRWKYGLQVSLHCALATWVSHELSWGLSAVKLWPREAARRAPKVSEKALSVPATCGGRRNLALLPGAKANASSVFMNGTLPIHQLSHLNDGWYGNSASWIADQLPAWAEIDLGGDYEVSEVRLGNDHAGRYLDRSAVGLRILVATNYSADSGSTNWQIMAESLKEPLLGEKIFSFRPTIARWVRVEILNSQHGMPRLDEIEIYEATPVSETLAMDFANSIHRGSKPPPPLLTPGPLLCLGSKQYLAEAEKRLLANCADGVSFLMFDGNWWNGGCDNPAHGHPVPYHLEDHIRANIDLVQRIHAQYPKVLIELHDPGAGGSSSRIIPVYYKYGLPGSYDENWGFELMWDPMSDLKADRARALYYYNLGCNVPIYLHVDLHRDNRSCLVLWWYASTCRHLGIGGTSPDPRVVEAEKIAMQQYRKWDRFYKRGEFFGITKEIHLHALPADNAVVVNIFNLSDQPRTIEGSIPISKMGLDAMKQYAGSKPWGAVDHGILKVSLKMQPWSADVAIFQGE